MSFLFNLVPWWGRLLAVGAVLVAAAAFGAVKMHSHDQTKYEALELAYSNFRSDVAIKGAQAEKLAQEKEKKDKEVNDALSKQVLSAASQLGYLEQRLREHPPSRPDGSQVPVTACHPESPVAAGTAESVPLKEYLELQARAAYDAETVMFWRIWAQQHGVQVE